jgi:hypothetical protein
MSYVLMFGLYMLYCSSYPAYPIVGQLIGGLVGLHLLFMAVVQTKLFRTV